MIVDLPLQPPPLPLRLYHEWGLPLDAQPLVLRENLCESGSVTDAIFITRDHFWMIRLNSPMRTLPDQFCWDDWIKLGMCQDCLCLADPSLDRYADLIQFIRICQKKLSSDRHPSQDPAFPSHLYDKWGFPEAALEERFPVLVDFISELCPQLGLPPGGDQSTERRSRRAPRLIAAALGLATLAGVLLIRRR